MKYLVIVLSLAFINTTSFAQQALLQKVISVTKNSSIKISATNRNVNVISWNEDKVKVVFVGVAADPSSVDDKMDKLGVMIHQLGNNLNIMIKEGDYSSINSMNDFDQDNVTSSPDNGSSKPSTMHSLKDKKSITIYVPQADKIKLDSRFGNISFTNYFPSLNLDITNGSVDAEKIGSLLLSSRYANFSATDIDNAEVDFINGNLTINNINRAALDTKYSTIEIASVKDLTMSSTNDEYILDEVNEVIAVKNYGNFRIGKLSGNIELNGINAEVKIRNIASTVSKIKIDNKYADIRLPLKSIKNFNINYAGPYSNISAPFDIQKEGGDEDLRFSVNSGRSSAMGATKIDMKCLHCTIDFR